MVHWDADALKDLLVGQPDGTIAFFRNINSNDEPIFDDPVLLQVGPASNKVDINVGPRAVPKVVDWNNDELNDLVVGGLDGLIHIFINEGAALEPDFLEQRLAQYDDGGFLQVPTERSAPAVRDLDEDDKKDLLSGNTEGRVVFYSNTGPDEDPVFDPYYLYVRSGFAPLHLPPPPPDGPRTRPAICFWSNDGLPDLLVGAADGQVHLYQDPFPAGDMNCDARVDFGDINPFVLALVNQMQYEFAFPHCDLYNADCNGDGEVNFGDINAFVELLTG